MTTIKEAVPFIDKEAEFAATLTVEQRRNLPFAAPFTTEGARYTAARRNEDSPAAPAPKP